MSYESKLNKRSRHKTDHLTGGSFQINKTQSLVLDFCLDRTDGNGSFDE